jgi:hypothetical protein
MKINEIFRSFSKNPDDDIKKKLDMYFTLSGSYSKVEIKDGIVNVSGDIELKNTRIIKILPVKFGEVSGSFRCERNNLGTLEGCPTIVGSHFSCGYNRLNVLNHGPKEVGKNYNFYGNNIFTLDGLPNYAGGVMKFDYFDTSPLLKILFVKGIRLIELIGVDNNQSEADQVSSIVNKYLGKGKAGALQCAAELAKAGFKGNAKR